jgi:hypothetical protein
MKIIGVINEKRKGHTTFEQCVVLAVESLA